MTNEEKEEAKKIATEYTYQKLKEQADTCTAINLRRILHQSAIKHLPTEAMKKNALTPDNRPFPNYRIVPTWTPPTPKRSA